LSDDEDLDPVHLSAQLERMSSMLESTCSSLEEKNNLDLLPDNAYDWWESLKDNRRQYAKEMADRREELIATAIGKLSPAELEAIRNG
jgi:hypothetical protein